MTTIQAMHLRSVEILSAFDRFEAEHGHPPSLREIAGATGYSTAGSLSLRLEQLVSGGYLERCAACERTRGNARNVRLTDKGREAIGS